MTLKYEAPFIDPNKVKVKSTKIVRKKRKAKRKTKKKVRRKKIKVLRYAIDLPNLTTPKLSFSESERKYWSTVKIPSNEFGSYITVSFEDILNRVNLLIYDQYDKIRKNGGKPNYQEFLKNALDTIGCFDYWSRGRICSQLSKWAAVKRKAKKERTLRQKIEQARQAELSLHIPKEH